MNLKSAAPPSDSFTTVQIGPENLSRLRELLAVFGEAFEDSATYTDQPANDAYLRNLLSGGSFIALCVLQDQKVLGGIAAYELHKFEQQRSEIYLYDMAVLATYRRQGVATAAIEELKRIAIQRGASGIFVQADTDADDEPAIALYSGLGERAEVLHFDLRLDPVPRD